MLHMTTTNDATALVLERALTVLDRDGWHQGSSCGPNDEACLSNAVSRAALELRATLGFDEVHAAAMDAYQAVAHVIRGLPPTRHRLLSTGPGVLPEWNDYVAQDVSQVREVLKLAHDSLLTTLKEPHAHAE